MTLRPQTQRGLFATTPIEYGRSVLGAPLLYFPAELHYPAQKLASSAENTSKTGLILAGTHGDETASMVALSCALRSLPTGALAHHVILSMNPDGNQLGTRGNANGVDLNRNFASQNWQAGGTVYRWNTQAPERDVIIKTGDCAASEPETQSLCALIETLNPAWVISFHDPLACIDDPNHSELGQWLSKELSLPMVDDVGYATPGSFGSWCAERDLLNVTVEFAPISNDEASEQYLEQLIKLLTNTEFTVK